MKKKKLIKAMEEQAAYNLKMSKLKSKRVQGTKAQFAWEYGHAILTGFIKLAKGESKLLKHKEI